MKEQYVLLTGSKNNAGDFLIKDRAKSLLTWLRPDRALIDIDGWKPFSEETLSTVNESRALVLMGGPALQEKMRPRVYGLIEDLSAIRVPIVTMGIGWHSVKGDWNSTHSYSLNSQTMELLERVEGSGYISSVRDYHTLNVLRCHGFKNYLMTGCPALYSQPHLEAESSTPDDVKKIGFSLGVSFKTSGKMFRQMQLAVTELRNAMPNAKVIVAFHHGLNEDYLRSPSASPQLHRAQTKFQCWLESENVPYQDISGSADKLKSFYSDCDLHVGYRVHAHIFMSSIGKPSVLLNEDGRGKALAAVLGGLQFDAYSRVQHNVLVKILHKLGVPFDNFTPSVGMPEDMANLLRYELQNGVRLASPFDSIRRHLPVMRRFIELLP